MDVRTTRFGTISVEPEDELNFPAGLIGLEHCKRWVVLTDSGNPALAWLQSLDEGHIALGIVSPRRFVSDYQLRVDRNDLHSLGLATSRDAQVVVIASRQHSGLSLNLRAPVVINVEGRRGCQVIAKDDLPVQYPLSLPPASSSAAAPLKRTA